MDVTVALLGDGNVGSAVDRLLTEGANEIERATGHRLRVVRRRRSAKPSARVRGGGPTEDVSGADAAAKMSILATVAFGSRVVFDDVDHDGIEQITAAQAGAARRFALTPRLIGSAPLVDGRLDVRCGRPSSTTAIRSPP